MSDAGESVRDVEELMAAIAYRFDDPDLLERALTHASFRNENPAVRDNQRLEFLGDSILGAVIAHLLSDAHPDASEGPLTRFRQVLVSEPGLVETAHSVDLGAYVRLGKGEQMSGGRQKASVLADAMEAVIGAVYRDGGFGAALGVIERLYGDRLSSVDVAARRTDPKTALQEWAQAERGRLPAYSVIRSEGPDHARTWEARVRIGDDIEVSGRGRTRKAAEQAAAREALRLTSVSGSEAKSKRT